MQRWVSCWFVRSKSVVLWGQLDVFECRQTNAIQAERQIVQWGKAQDGLGNNWCRDLLWCLGYQVLTFWPTFSVQRDSSSVTPGRRPFYSQRWASTIFPLCYSVEQRASSREPLSYSVVGCHCNFQPALPSTSLIITMRRFSAKGNNTNPKVWINGLFFHAIYRTWLLVIETGCNGVAW